jgi:hypothetical protein
VDAGRGKRRLGEVFATGRPDEAAVRRAGVEVEGLRAELRTEPTTPPPMISAPAYQSPRAFEQPAAARRVSSAAEVACAPR